MKLFDPHENRQKPTRILDPGFRRISRILGIFSKFWLSAHFWGFTSLQVCNGPTIFATKSVGRIHNRDLQNYTTYKIYRCSGLIWFSVHGLANVPFSAEKML